MNNKATISYKKPGSKVRVWCKAVVCAGLFLGIFAGKGYAFQSTADLLSQNHRSNSGIGIQFIEVEKQDGNHYHISIDVENMGLADVLEAITSQINVGLSYDSETDLGHKVSLKAENVDLHDALRSMLAGTGLEYLVSLNRNTLVIRPGQTEEIEAQQTVTGRVTDGQTGEALPGVNVIVVGSDEETGSIVGTQTDMDGNYSVNVPEGLNTLAFTYIGYQRLEVDIDGRTEIDIQLLQDIQMLDDVVVVGYGTQRRADITTAVTSISGENISQRSSRNLTSSLQGLAPGVSVSDLGGEPGGANTNIRIRGVTTLGNTNPLFIVDGVQTTAQDINPNDIESITILEDATSTAIYGSRAANGVIIIQTKRGAVGDIQVSYNGKIDFQNLTVVPEHMETEEYMRLQNLGFANRGSAPRFSEEDIQNTIAGNNPLEYPQPNNWFNTVIRNNAPMMDHSISISGGGETLRTYGSLSFFDQQGIYPNRSVQKYVFNLNNDIRITDEFSLTADLRIRRNDRNTTNNIGGGLYHNMIHGSQFAVPRYPDGTYGLSPQGHNPLAYTDPNIAGVSERSVNTTVGNIEGRWEVLEGLTLSSRVAIDLEEYSAMINLPTYEIRDYNNPNVVLQNRQINSLQEERRESVQLTWYSTVNYVVNFANHNVDFLGGYSQESYDYKQVSAAGRNLYNNDLRGLGQTESETRDIGSAIQDWGLRSFFSRINYNYDQRYLFQLNMRYDGSSRFPEGNRYTYFPSASIGWRISEERLWEPLKPTIDNFMLRASWGETGNQNVGLYTYFDNLNLQQNVYAFNDNPQLGTHQNQVTSENLTWEITTQTNLGFDASFYEGLFEASFDWYKKVTDGILLTLPIAGVVGLNPAATNAGIVENVGWGLQITHRNYLSDNAFYRVTVNFSDVKNEITSLAGVGPFFSGARDWMVRMEGHPIDAIWGYETGGFLTEEDFENNYPVFSPDAEPGDIKYIDRNGDGIINADDRRVLGSVIPRFEYGLNADFGWKNIDLNLQFQGVGKRDVGLVGAFPEGGTWEGFTLKKAGDYWTPENPNARFPRPQKQTLKNQQPSDWWVVDGSYIRLKNLQLGYNVPAEFTSKVGLSRLRFFIGGTNLLTFSKLNDWGIDAEAPLGRGDYYPPVKTYTIGVNVNF